MINVVIVEDEALTAKRLVKQLQNLAPDFEIIAQLNSIEATVSWFEKNPLPDLAFFDVNLSDGLSFEIFKLIQITCPIIFTTAYDQYAIKAFKLNSIDYLLKPIDENELKAAIQKFRNQDVKGSNVIDIKTLLTAISNPASESYKQRFLVPFRDTLVPISTLDIAYFYVQNKITYLVTHKNENYSIDENLEELELVLNPKQFMRATRQLIINSTAINKLHQHFNNRVKLELTPPFAEEIIVSRDKSTEFKEWLNK